MSCQNRYNNQCQQYAKKEAYRQANRRNPLIENLMAKWECDEEFEKTCSQHKPFPPRMTQEEFDKTQIEILNKLPKEFQSAVSYMAWESGHSAGYEEVIGILREMVSSLEKPIWEFEKRIRTGI